MSHALALPEASSSGLLLTYRTGGLGSHDAPPAARELRRSLVLSGYNDTQKKIGVLLVSVRG